MSEVGLDVQTMYQYATHRNVPWNIVEYQPVPEYLDAGKMLEEKAGSKTERYVTRKVGFLDQHIKNVKDLPASCKYEAVSTFDQTLNKKESRKHKIDFKLKKNTYLEQIESLAKIYKAPGVGKYHLQTKSTSKPKRKQQKISQKPCFYQDSEFLSSTVPGSGCYYPRQQVQHIKQERTNHHFWVEKHKKQNDKNRKRSLKETDPGTYRPVSASFNSFDRISLDNEKRKKKLVNKKPTNGFGSSDTKFTYERTQKSKGETRPDPCNYNTMIEWKGKGLDAKKNNWVRCLSAGPSRTVYH